MDGKCRGPAIDESGDEVRCSRPAIAEGTCAAHYRQLLRARTRGKPEVMKPLRLRGTRDVVGAIRVSHRALAALEAKGPTPYAAARDVIEEWARGVKLSREVREALDAGLPPPPLVHALVAGSRAEALCETRSKPGWKKGEKVTCRRCLERIAKLRPVKFKAVFAKAS